MGRRQRWMNLVVDRFHKVAKGNAAGICYPTNTTIDQCVSHHLRALFYVPELFLFTLVICAYFLSQLMWYYNIPILKCINISSHLSLEHDDRQQRSGLYQRCGSSLYCLFGSHVESIVTAVNQRFKQLPSSLKEQDTNFSEPVFLRTFL